MGTGLALLNIPHPASQQATTYSGKMRCWAALPVVVLVAGIVAPGMGQTYGGGSGGSTSGTTSGTGGTFASGQTGSSAAAGSAPGSSGSTGSGFAGFTDDGRPSGAGGAAFVVGAAAGTGGPAFVGPAAGARGSAFAGATAGRGVAGFPGFVGPAGPAGSGGQGGAGAFQRGTSVIQQQVTPTVTQTVTVDRFTTLTDIVFQSYGVTLTQFLVETATRPVQAVVVTPVNDQVAVSTTVLHRPEFVTLTETKSDFRLAVRTSVTHVTLTHTAYNIMHVPFTITATETVHLTSPVVRTVIDTQRQVVTDYRTVYNTIYARGGYY